MFQSRLNGGREQGECEGEDEAKTFLKPSQRAAVLRDGRGRVQQRRRRREDYLIAAAGSAKAGARHSSGRREGLPVRGRRVVEVIARVEYVGG